MPKIKEGYYIKARKLQHSEIAHAAPCIREIWDWLLMNANHKDYGPIRDGFRHKIKRGQLVRTYKDVQEALSWYRGYYKKTYSKSQCEYAFNWLTNRNMIDTRRTTRGLLISIINYDVYQNPENYISAGNQYNINTTSIQSPSTINNNDNNEKNDNNNKLSGSCLTASEISSSDKILFNSLRNWFIGYTRDNINEHYIFGAKEGRALKLIINKLKQIAKKDNPAATDEIITNAFKHICTGNNDRWIKDHWELAIINSKFNNIIQSLQNGGYNQKSFDPETAGTAASLTREDIFGV